MELDGQVAIVTGGGRGIGRATALELARMGAAVAVAELDPENAKRTAGEVDSLGRPALAIATDVTRRADLEAMVRRTLERFQRIDILVNNAGIYRAAATLDVTEEHWDTMLAINAKAVFFTAQAVLPTMIAQHRGAIISLASKRLAREFGHRMGFGIGIHAGPAALGEVGYRDTRTLSAVGDTVNTASRLQELTKHYGVQLVISERVALAAGLEVSSLEAKELVIRGRLSPLTVYALRSIAESGA